MNFNEKERVTIKELYANDYITSGMASIKVQQYFGMSTDDAENLVKYWNHNSDVLHSSAGPRTLQEWRLYERAKKMHDGGFSYRDAVGILARDVGVMPKRVKEVIGTSEEWNLGYFDDGLAPLNPEKDYKPSKRPSISQSMGLFPFENATMPQSAISPFGKDLIESEVESLWSMANFRKDRSGLPVNVWLDEGQTYRKGGYGYRLKFQINKQNQVTNTELATMTISDDPQVIGKHELSANEIQQLKDFIKRNKTLLMQLSDMEIDFLEFRERMR